LRYYIRGQNQSCGQEKNGFHGKQLLCADQALVELEDDPKRHTELSGCGKTNRIFALNGNNGNDPF
jgi:hypothetical protein